MRKEEPPACTDYIPIRAHEPDAAIAVKALEETVDAPVCTLLLNIVPRTFQGGGGALAEELRGILGLGTAPVGDLIATLRYRGVRIVETKFAKSVGSVSLWDAAHNAPVILLNSRVTAERRRYRLVYELGSAALFASIGVRLDETLEQHRFLTDFTASFLMPGVAVRICVAAVGILPDAWKLAEVLPLKSYFGVSAEAFVLRLEELGLIVPSLRIALRERLRAYYKQHPKAMEPQPKGRKGL